jgi:hypothetical protein
MGFFKTILPKKIYEKIRSAILFRAEDPSNLHQILPPRITNTSVERIKGFRYPAPGSRVGARIPTRDSDDDLYETSYLSRNPNNLPKEHVLSLNTSNGGTILLADDNPRAASHGKRKISQLPYDPSGLRTTKTATWEALDTVLADRAKPNHLVAEEWRKDYAQMCIDAEAKGLPMPLGRRHKWQTSANINTVRW